MSSETTGPDGREWAKTKAGYEFVESMVPRADDKANLMWFGWALREAFVAGAEWQEKRKSETTVEVTPGLIDDAALKQQVYAEIRQAYTRACLKAFEEWQAEIKANDRTSRGSPYL